MSKFESFPKINYFEEIEDLNLDPKDYVICGSAAAIQQGLLEPNTNNDINILIYPEVLAKCVFDIKLQFQVTRTPNKHFYISFNNHIPLEDDDPIGNLTKPGHLECVECISFSPHIDTSFWFKMVDKYNEYQFMNLEAMRVFYTNLYCTYHDEKHEQILKKVLDKLTKLHDC